MSLPDARVSEGRAGKVGGQGKGWGGCFHVVLKTRGVGLLSVCLHVCVFVWDKRQAFSIRTPAAPSLAHSSQDVS